MRLHPTAPGRKQTAADAASLCRDDPPAGLLGRRFGPGVAGVRACRLADVEYAFPRAFRSPRHPLQRPELVADKAGWLASALSISIEQLAGLLRLAHG